VDYARQKRERQLGMHPLVRQDGFEDEIQTIQKPQTYDEKYRLVNAFIQGANLWTFLPNCIDCSYYSQIFLNDFNYTSLWLNSPENTNVTYDRIRNVSGLISNQFAEAYLYCHMTVYDGYIYYLAEQEKYPGGGLEWFQSFLQNMVGNIINITNLYNKVLVAQENKDQELTYFILGKIFYSLMDFEPLDLEDLEAPLSGEKGSASLAKIISMMGVAMQYSMELQRQQVGTNSLEQESYLELRKEYLSKVEEGERQEQWRWEQEVRPVVREALVMQESPRPANESQEKKGVLQTVGEYSDYVGTFLWYTQLSSVGQVAGNLSLCSGNATIFYNKTLGVAAEYQREYYGEAGRSTYRILKSIDPIIYSCYFTLFEYYVAMVLYSRTARSGSKLSYNFVHNLGSIYDLTEEAYFKIVNFRELWQTQEFWKRMGIIVGTNFQNLFEDPENFYEFSEESARHAEERNYDRTYKKYEQA
jgi:hypothetical protein